MQHSALGEDATGHSDTCQSSLSDFLAPLQQQSCFKWAHLWLPIYSGVDCQEAAAGRRNVEAFSRQPQPHRDTKSQSYLSCFAGSSFDVQHFQSSFFKFSSFRCAEHLHLTWTGCCLEQTGCTLFLWGKIIKVSFKERQLRWKYFFLFINDEISGCFHI